jgi:hypothetical protein
MQFQDSIIENNVDGIQKISYYLCKENHSYLFLFSALHLEKCLFVKILKVLVSNWVLQA